MMGRRVNRVGGRKAHSIVREESVKEGEKKRV
jgi:hypothetical protein